MSFVLHISRSSLTHLLDIVKLTISNAERQYLTCSGNLSDYSPFNVAHMVLKRHHVRTYAHACTHEPLHDTARALGHIPTPSRNTVHTRTHARTHTRTHAHTHVRERVRLCVYACQFVCSCRPIPLRVCG